MSLSKSEFERYQRQLLVDGWDQDKLRNSSALIVGMGGLGGVSAAYLAAAGVGHLRLCDNDKVELSNLNRQILYDSADIGKPKAVLAAERLSELNPDIEIECSSEKLTDGNFGDLASGCNLIIDGLDNHADRLILNRASFTMNIPYIYGAINEWQGQACFFSPPKTPCLACLIPGDVKNAKPTPVFGALPGVIGSIQAAMAIRHLLTGELPLKGKMLIFYADSMEFETVAFDKNPDCPVCGFKK